MIQNCLIWTRISFFKLFFVDYGQIKAINAKDMRVVFGKYFYILNDKI